MLAIEIVLLALAAIGVYWVIVLLFELVMKRYWEDLEQQNLFGPTHRQKGDNDD